MPEENRKSKWIYVRWFAIRFFLVVYDIIAVNAACYLALLTRFYVAKQFHSAAAQVGIKDIRQKSGDVLFTLSNLNFEAVGALCSDPDYKQRVTFLASAKEPTLRFKLANGVDSLKQSKLFVEHYTSFFQS